MSSTAMVLRNTPVLGPSDARFVARAVVASALIGSAVVHGTLVGEHFGEWLLAGVFFVGLQVVELALALLSVSVWDRRVARAVVASCLAIVLVWLVSRTTGMPFGPPGFRQPEAVGVPDLACLVLELTCVLVGLPTALGKGSPPQPVRAREPLSRRGRTLAGVAVAGALGLVVWGAAPSIGPNAEGHHENTSVSVGR